MIKNLFLLLAICFSIEHATARTRENFCSQWKFFLGDDAKAKTPGYDDKTWRMLNLPHDWSIEGKFDADNPAGIGGGALPGGVGWYRKSFNVPADSKNKKVFIYSFLK